MAGGKGRPGGRVGPPAALALVLLAAAGCAGAGAGGPTGSPATVVGDAPDRTIAAGPAQVKIDAPAATASGLVDLQTGSGRFSVLLPGMTRRRSVDLAAGQWTSGGPPDTAVAGAGGQPDGQPDTAVAGAGGQPDTAVAGARGQPDTAVAGARGQPDAEVAAALRSGDPAADLDLLRGAVHILSDGGSEVDGTGTIRYTVTVDPDRARAATPAGRRPALDLALQDRRHRFTIDVWVDTAGRARRVEVPTDLRSETPPTRVDRLAIAADVDFLSFGAVR